MYTLEQIDKGYIQIHPEEYTSAILRKELKQIDEDINECMDDPMTEYSGCGDEIAFDMRRKGSAIFTELCYRGDEEFDGDCMTDSYWCPTRRP